VISDNVTTLAFVVADVTGTSNRVLNAIRDGVEASTGIPRGNIHIASTHTHGGPDLQGLWNGSSENYQVYFANGMIEAITIAYQNRRLVRLFVSEANGTDWFNNRRGHGWTNDAITTLEARDFSTNAVVGTVVNFAAHPTNTGSSNRLFTGDWCWYVNEAMENARNGAPSAFFNGPQGDVSGLGGCGGGADVWENVEICGSRMAGIALDSIAQNAVELSGPIYIETRYFNHAVSNVGFILAYYIGWLDYDAVINGTDFSFDTQTSYFRIGAQIQGVSFPGESLTRNGFPILEAMTAPFKLFVGLTGDTLGYFVPSDEWNIITGYEEKVSIHRDVGDFTRDLLIEMIQADADRNK